MDNRSDGLIDKVWDIFSSMKTGLVLLGLVAIVSAIGTLIPQESLDPEGARAVSEIWRTLGFTRVYNSPVFQFLLGLLCINLIVCSVQRFGGIYKMTYKPEPIREQAKLPQKVKATVTGSRAEELKQKTLALFKKKGFHVTELEKEGKWCFTAQKHRSGNWGSFVTHIAFVILILGALIGSLSGFKGYMMASEGSVVPIQEIEISKGKVQENFMVRINSVEDRILPTGERDNWYTNLSIIESGVEVLQGTLSVNHPLTYKGVTFYQSSYATGALFNLEVEGKEYTIPLHNGGIYNPPGTHLYLVLAGMKTGAENSVILYQLYNEKSQIGMGQLTSGESDTIDDTYKLTFDKAIAFTGLQVKKDPGVWVVWLGSALLMVGLVLCFYWRPVRIAGILETKEDHEARLDLGAHTGKLYTGIKEEFEKLIEELKE